MIYLLVIGFISILGQVALLRELSVAFYGVELIYSLALGIWLLWTAAGTLIGRWAEKPSCAAIQILFVLFALLLPADIAFIRSIRVIFSGITGAYLPFQTQVLAMAASLLPISLVLGLMFQWTARAYLEEGKSLAQAYAIESLGGLAGGICSTLFLMSHMRNFLYGHDLRASGAGYGLRSR